MRGNQTRVHHASCAASISVIGACPPTASFAELLRCGRSSRLRPPRRGRQPRSFGPLWNSSHCLGDTHQAKRATRSFECGSGRAREQQFLAPTAAKRIKIQRIVTMSATNPAAYPRPVVRRLAQRDLGEDLHLILGEASAQRPLRAPLPSAVGPVRAHCRPSTCVTERPKRRSKQSLARRHALLRSATCPLQGRTPDCYFDATIPGGFQVPTPAGRIEGGVSLGQYRRITR